ncbi:MAG: hypothetical protein ACSLFD_04825 [Solirubrobacterales bacterium]
MTEAADSAFTRFQQSIADLRAALRRSSAQRISARTTKDAAKGLVQAWFREIRPQLHDEGIDDSLFEEMDAALQSLLQLSNAYSRRPSYVSALTKADAQVRALEMQRELEYGRHQRAPAEQRLSSIEQRIVDTLDALVPSAGLSYRQAILDMQDGNRVSYRGTANELRSALWDVLDRLAPDADVMAASGFKLEKNRDKPTHKQKARYILKSRLGDTARRTPESTLDLVEERVGALARAVYDRSSVSTHVATAVAEVRQVKMYVDTLLAELLEVHTG